MATSMIAAPGMSLYNPGTIGMPGAGIPAELGAYNVLSASDPTSALLQSGGIPAQPGGYTGGLGAYETSPIGPLANTQPGGLENNLGYYYNLFGKLDPNSVATSKSLSNFYNGLAANPSRLDPQTETEISQAARNAQTARGNALGTSQATDEALTTGMYGLQQRNANLGMVQNWLNSGQTPWGQQIGAYNFGTGATNAAAGNILNYLNSGQTIESLGSQELNNLINQSTNAAGGFNYSPNSTLGSPYTFVNPNAGLSGSNSANQWYNSLGAFGQQPIQPNSNAQLLGLGLGGFNSLVNSGALGGLGGIFGSAGGLAGLSGLGAGATIGGLTAIGAGGIGGGAAAGSTGLGLGAIGTAAGLAF